MQVRLQNLTGRRVTDGEIVRLHPSSVTAFVVANLNEYGIFGTVSGTIDVGQYGYINLINTVDYTKLLNVPATFPPDDHDHDGTYQLLDEDLTRLAETRSIGSDTDYTVFDSTGHQSMVGNARPWRDELGDALSIQKNGVGITLDLDDCTINFDYNAVYHATASLSDMLYKNVQLNHDRDLTSVLHPHIHWFQEKNYVPNFLLGYRWQTLSKAKVTPWTLIACNTVEFPYIGSAMHQLSEIATPIAVPANTVLSDIVQFRIYRDTTNASGKFIGGTDPYNTGGNASAKVLSFDVHFMLNSLGSTDELTK